MPKDRPKISLCQLSFPFSTFDEDLAIAAAVGARGLGLDETKLAATESERAAQQERFAQSGLTATICAPAVLSILPRDPSRDRGPRSPAERIELIAAGIDKLAAFGAESVFCATGPVGDLDPEEARRIVVDAYRLFARRAAAAGTRFAIEPMREPFRPLWTFVCDLAQTNALIDEIGEDVGIVFDTWHMWDSANVRALIPDAIDRIVGVQIADYRDPTRAIRDRLAAGEGVADIAGLVALIDKAGYRGWYDMEVFSDVDLEGSLWKLSPHDFAERQVKQFLRCWDA